MELREIALILIRGYKIVAATLLITVTSALIALSVQTPEYRAMTLIYVNVEIPQDATIYATSNATRVSQARTITFKELVTTPLILDGVIDRLSLNMSSADLADQVLAQSALDTPIVEISVDWPVPEMAAQIANEIATGLISTAVAVGPSSLTVVQAQPAVVPAAPHSPKPAVMLGLAGFAGLFLGSAIVLLRQGFRRRVYLIEQLESITDLPVVGQIGRDQIVAIRNIAATISAAESLQRVRAIAVVAARPTAATTAIAQGLAGVLAETATGYSVVASPAALAERATIDNLVQIDSALLVVTLGFDSIPEITTALAHLHLLGVTVGGLILLQSSHRSRRPQARGVRDAG